MALRFGTCREVAEDEHLATEAKSIFRSLKATPTAPLFPWFPTPGRIGRLRGGWKFYRMLEKIIMKCKREGRREDDPLQGFIDMEYYTLHITQVSSAMGSRETNVLLATADYDDDTLFIGNKYGIDCRLDIGLLPSPRWVENPGRKRDRSICRGTLCPTADLHLNPDFYPAPGEFDPTRWLPEAVEERKNEHGVTFLGWGAGRHQCLEKRAAILMMKSIVASLVAQFEVKVVDSDGAPLERIPESSVEVLGKVGTPNSPVFLEYKRREFPLH